MSNRKKIPRLYHIRYVADFLVPALSNREALGMVDEELTDMVEGEDYALGDIFNITIEKDKFHIIEVVDEDDEDDEEGDDEGEDEDCEDDDEDDDEE